MPINERAHAAPPALAFLYKASHSRSCERNELGERRCELANEMRPRDGHRHQRSIFWSPCFHYPEEKTPAPGSNSNVEPKAGWDVGYWYGLVVV
ncbi:hypothetical protein AK812_SmicGene32126 [Symbiodinium microadriaticum]|uniref:Uncharacterized protein n=1 Tax=Symbiodinium microadriaticum TaxID=2951 RepID=A0A1Q9CUZ0_SYMMI|nr:hypothetical protein AK812_SmicGene32126 [Symbiodinium microadriaticum]